MIFQEFGQDDDCSHPTLVEEGDLRGDGRDWQPRTEGILASVPEVFTKITRII